MAKYRDYFLKTMTDLFGKAVYDARGNLATRVYMSDDDMTIKCVVYTLSLDELSSFEEDDWSLFTLVNATYDLSDVDLDSIVSISAKIPGIVTDFEGMLWTGA